MSVKWEYAPFDPAIDAYLDWALGPGKKFPPGFVEYVIPSVFQASNEFDISRITQRFGGEFARINGNKLLSFFPDTHISQDFLNDLNFFTGLLPVSLLVKLQNNPEFQSLVSRVVVGRPIPADAVCKQPEKVKTLGKSKSKPIPAANREAGKNTVIIGIIDEGLAFANERFRNGLTASRVEYAWIQDAKCVGPVERFSYGREWRKKTIDKLLAECLRGEQIDEDKFYARAGMADFSRSGHKAVAWRIAHGAHVMDLAAGFPQGEPPTGAEGQPENWHIISVQLPTSTIAETSGLGLDKFLLDGVDYIFDRATRIAEERGSGELPVVINFSSGIRGGPHDGTSLIESALDERICKRRRETCAPTQIVLPAGNSFLARSHARFELKPGGKKRGSARSIEWFVPPDDKTFSFVEIWLPGDIPQDEEACVALEIATPFGLVSKTLTANPSGSGKNAVALKSGDGQDDVLCKAYYQHVGAPTNRGRFMIALVPTAFHNPPSMLAPVGRWKITLKNLRNRDTEIDAWIHWDDSPINYKRHGRQSYFMDQNYTRFDKISGREIEEDQEASLIKRKGTTSAIAMGTKPVVVGGIFRKEHKAASYTAADMNGRYDKPDFMTVCEASSALLGVLAAGTKSGSTVALNGTSIAAPQVTRRIAEFMAAGKSDAQIIKLLIKQASKDEHDLARHTCADHPEFPGVMKERKGVGRLRQKISRMSERQRFVDS